ncbi:MAG: TadE/TadG family type IV pilus assembly protein [Planctomycetota bacterium]|nr:TadE/TadG family type IV pilus assembly protein [Planctomycetota bacterium]
MKTTVRDDRRKRRFAGGTGLARARSAVIVFELIVTLPLLLVVLIAVIEFGIIMAGFKQVAIAARTGASVASNTAGLDTGTPLSTQTAAQAARTAIDRQLETAGFGTNASSGLTLRHNVSDGVGIDPPEASHTEGTCSDPTAISLPARAVRVTLCVEMSTLAPDMLSSFGFSLNGRTIEESITYPYE